MEHNEFSFTPGSCGLLVARREPEMQPWSARRAPSSFARADESSLRRALSIPFHPVINLGFCLSPFHPYRQFKTFLSHSSSNHPSIPFSILIFLSHYNLSLYLPLFSSHHPATPLSLSFHPSIYPTMYLSVHPPHTSSTLSIPFLSSFFSSLISEYIAASLQLTVYAMSHSKAIFVTIFSVSSSPSIFNF